MNTDVNTKYPVLYRTYCRKSSDALPRETELEAKNRVLGGLKKLGKFNDRDFSKIKEYLYEDKLFCSGRYFWAGGTEYSEKHNNYYSLYNCSSLYVSEWEDLATNFSFLMQGCGVGSVLEFPNVENLPTILTKINLSFTGEFGSKPNASANTNVSALDPNEWYISVGDSREGWVKAYQSMLELSSTSLGEEISIIVDVSSIRKAGEQIKGFGGKSNPVGIKPLFEATVRILNEAKGRKLRPLEVSYLLNETALCVVAGNIRRSARIDQFSKEDTEAATAKDNLWTQNEEGKWSIDESKNSLRMANFTRLYHTKPTLNEITEAVTKQYYSGEGAIMYVPEAVARANADLLHNEERKSKFISLYIKSQSEARNYLRELLTNND